LEVPTDGKRSFSIPSNYFKYQLPLSTREHKVPVTASYYYDPDAEKKRKLGELESSSSRKEQKRKLSSHLVLPKALGRYDRRALLVTDSQ
jgi:hypothetical protein